MTNLLQENKEIESPRTNCTTSSRLGGIWFLPAHKNQLKKTKRAIFCLRTTENNKYLARLNF